MLLRRPAYFDDFHCTADRCTDSCCIGWEVDIDAARAREYATLPGTFGDRLRAAMKGDPPHFDTTATGRCVFLNDSNLCEIICALGEGALCSICAEHPRFYHWLPGITEVGLGLCCEEAARLTFCTDVPDCWPTKAVQSTADVANDLSQDASFAEILLGARETAFALVQDRTRPIGLRMTLLLAFADDLQSLSDDLYHAKAVSALCAEYRDTASLAALSESMDALCRSAGCQDAAACTRTKLLHFFALPEPIDPDWPKLLARLAKGPLPAAPTRADFETAGAVWCEHLLCYFLYRYFTDAITTGDVLGQVQFVLAAVCVLRLLAQDRVAEGDAFLLADQVCLAKTFSKEVEYALGLPNQFVQMAAEEPTCTFSSFCAALIW